MRDKIGFLFGIFFLMSLFSLISVSALYGWESYGNNISSMPNAQISSINSRFDLGIINSSISQGMSVKNPVNYFIFFSNIYTRNSMDYQPLVSDFGNPDVNYLVFSEGNNIDFYTNIAGNLALINFYDVGAVLNSQLDVTDFDEDGTKNDLVGIWQINSTLNSFRVYSFNYSTEILNKTYEMNFTSNVSINNSGVRCSKLGFNKECQFIFPYSSGMYAWMGINNTGLRRTNFTLPSSTPFIEPPAYQDMDNDGYVEYLVYTKDYVMVVSPDIYTGNDTQVGKIFYNTGLTGILDAKFVKVGSSNIWKVAVLEYYHSGSGDPRSWSVELRLLSSNYPANSSPTIMWAKTIFSDSAGGFNSGAGMGKLAIGRDYNLDGFQDIYVSALNHHYVSAGGTYSNSYFQIYRGYDGSLLYSNMSAVSSSIGYINSFVLADMNGNNYDDFITLFNNGNLKILDSKINSTFSPTSSGSGGSAYSCIPADLGKTGFLDLICSGNGTTYLFSTLASNQNPIINSILFDPATTIPVGATLYATIFANDTENNTIYYASKCSDDSNWSMNTTNNLQSCFYGSAGTFNFVAGVKDSFHTSYTNFSTPIIVTATGIICNNNNICDAGETYSNCPNDCSSVPNTTQASEIGGMPLPTKLVDIQNTEQGLLPEIYYGTLAFLSGTLTPMIVLIFFIFFVLIIFAIGFIIKKMAKKVGELAR